MTTSLAHDPRRRWTAVEKRCAASLAVVRGELDVVRRRLEKLPAGRPVYGAVIEKLEKIELQLVIERREALFAIARLDAVAAGACERLQLPRQPEAPPINNPRQPRPLPAVWRWSTFARVR